jgi:hypothetical protein
MIRLSTSITAVVLVLVLSLAAVGVAYGLWARTLAIQGTVQTGEWVESNLKFTAASTNDPSGSVHLDPGKDKDVGSCTAEVVKDCSCGKSSLVKVLVSNAYPSYECEVDVTIEKGGSIPECIKYVTIKSPPELTVEELSHLTGAYLNRCGEEVKGRFRVHVEQSAEQAATYEFTVSIERGLWSSCRCQHGCAP